MSNGYTVNDEMWALIHRTEPATAYTTNTLALNQLERKLFTDAAGLKLV